MVGDSGGWQLSRDFWAGKKGSWFREKPDKERGFFLRPVSFETSYVNILRVWFLAKGSSGRWSQATD
jgi:hypothetical protein